MRPTIGSGMWDGGGGAETAGGKGRRKTHCWETTAGRQTDLRYGSVCCGCLLLTVIRVAGALVCAVLFEVSLVVVQHEQVWPFIRQRVMPAGRRGTSIVVFFFCFVAVFAPGWFGLMPSPGCIGFDSVGGGLSLGVLFILLWW